MISKVMILTIDGMQSNPFRNIMDEQTCDIPDLLRQGGFNIQQLDTLYVPSTPKVAGFTYWGFAD